MQDQIKDEWIEAGAQAMAEEDDDLGWRPESRRAEWYRNLSRIHIAAVAPLIRAEVEAGHHLLGNIERQAQTIAELRAEGASLKDPAAVRVNVLRGTIVIPDDLVWLHDTNGPVAALRADLAQAQAQIEALRKAGAKALNYIENTESELGITLDSGNDLRAALKEPSHDH